MLRNSLIALLAAAAMQPAFAQTDTDALADAVEARVIAWRRHIHQYPELSFQEVKTAAYVAEVLRAMPGIEIQTGIAKTGIKAVLKGGRPGPVVALRADMDALPVEERNDLPFRSQVKAMWQGKETGVMHACGHHPLQAQLPLAHGRTSRNVRSRAERSAAGESLRHPGPDRRPNAGREGDRRRSASSTPDEGRAQQRRLCQQPGV